MYASHATQNVGKMKHSYDLAQGELDIKRAQGIRNGRCCFLPAATSCL